MAKKPKKADEAEQIETDLSQEEAEDRRDEVLKKMLSTPPKPRKKPSSKRKP